MMMMIEERGECHPYNEKNQKKVCIVNCTASIALLKKWSLAS